MSVFPIIVGAARSGTTLLRAMLDSHPSMAIPPESYFLVGIGKRSRGPRRTNPFDPASFATELVSHHRFPLWDLDPDFVRWSIERRNPATAADGFRIVYQLYARAHGKSRYGDKTPWYINHIPFLSKLFLESRFVHIIRDGRDVSLSQGCGEIAGALAWRRAIRCGHEAERALGPHRYLQVRYEQLVTDPEETLGLICDFVDLPFDPAMLAYHERAEAIRSGFFRPNSAAHHRLSEPPRLRADDWRSRMTPKEICRFEVLAGDELSACGYPRDVSHTPTTAILGARLDESRLIAARLLRRMSKRFLRRVTPGRA